MYHTVEIFALFLVGAKHFIAVCIFSQYTKCKGMTNSCSSYMANEDDTEIILSTEMSILSR